LSGAGWKQVAEVHGDVENEVNGCNTVQDAELTRSLDKERCNRFWTWLH